MCLDAKNDSLRPHAACIQFNRYIDDVIHSQNFFWFMQGVDEITSHRCG